MWSELGLGQREGDGVSQQMSTARIRSSLASEIIAIAILVVATASAAWLRFYGLRDNPGWYSDEGSDIDIATGLLDGELGYFAIGGSPMIAARPLLFHAIVAGAFRAFGRDILILRAITAGYGVLAVPLLYLVGRRMVDRTTALVAACLLAIYPSAILYSRFGFNYNQLTPLFLGYAWCLWGYLDRRTLKWVVTAALLSGLAVITNPLATILIAILAVVIVLVNVRHLLIAVLCTVVLPGVYAGIMWAAFRDAFLFDLAYTFSRFSYALPVQVVGIVFNYGLLWEWDPWFIPGCVGLFFLSRRSTRLAVGMTFFGALFSVIRVAAVHGLGFYRVIPLFPFVCLGIAVLLVRGTPYVLSVLVGDVEVLLPQMRGRVWTWARRRAARLTVALGLFFCFLSPLLVVAVRDVNWAVDGFPTRESDAVAQDVDDAERAIGYLNAHTDHDDVVIASPYLVWALDGRAADFQQVLAYRGVETAHLPGNIAPERWRFDPSLENATYVVLDELWRGWASEAMSEVAATVSEVETWPLDARFGEFEIYRNVQRKGE